MTTDRWPGQVVVYRKRQVVAGVLHKLNLLPYERNITIGHKVHTHLDKSHQPQIKCVFTFADEMHLEQDGMLFLGFKIFGYPFAFNATS